MGFFDNIGIPHIGDIRCIDGGLCKLDDHGEWIPLSMEDQIIYEMQMIIRERRMPEFIPGVQNWIVE